jgi:Flp pilus assembly protein TadG
MVQGPHSVRRTRSGNQGSRGHWRGRAREESGQSLVIIVLAMGLILALAGYAIDVSQWDAKRHQTQVTADAAALAAANCLASLTCTSTSAGGDAEQAGDKIAAANGYPQSAVTIGFTSSTVTVKIKGTASSAFAGLFGFATAAVSGNAVASYNTLTDIKFSCSSTGSTNCVSLFAGNSFCGTSQYPVGLDFASNGGGGSGIYDAYANGVTTNDSNSNGVWTVTGVSCAADTESLKNPKSSFTQTTTVLPYPAVWTQPTCDSSHTASTWTDAMITAGGTYCVTTPPAGGCSQSGSGAGYIVVDLGKLPSGEYEFVGPCVVLSGSRSSDVGAFPGQPLVYGTSNITTYATTTSPPKCVATDGSNGTSTWFTGNNVGLGAPIYDQCGTVDVSGNKVDVVGFIEAWNIVMEKNSGATGTGPTSITGGGVKTTPGGDTLSG